MNITKEQKDALNAVVKVDIKQEDFQPKVDKLLKDYRKNANIPGFRKGHVPMGMIKKQYGRAIQIDEVNKLLQQSLNDYIRDEKIHILGSPLPVEQEHINWDADTLSFEFELGIAPEFNVDLKTKKAITHYQIVADEKEITNQITRIRKQYGKMISKEKVSEKDSLTGIFSNSEEAIEKQTTFALEQIKSPETKAKLIGAKKGDSITINTKDLFEDEHLLMNHLGVTHDKAHGLAIDVEFKIEEINERELATLNQELFDKLFGEGNVSNEEELKAKLKEEMEQQFIQYSDQQLLNDVTETLIEETKFELPSTFLQKWLRSNGEKELTEEEAKDEFEKSEKSIRFQLIEGKLVEENAIKVEFEDIKNFAKERIKMQMAQFGQTDPEEKMIDDVAARVLANKEEVQRLYEQMLNQKILALYKEKANIKTKETSYEDFVKEVYEN